MALGKFALSPAKAQKDIPNAPEFGIATLGRGGECNQLSEASFCEPSLRNREGLLGSDDEAERKILLTSCKELPGRLPFFGSKAAMDRYYDAKRHQSKT